MDALQFSKVYRSFIRPKSPHSIDVPVEAPSRLLAHRRLHALALRVRDAPCAGHFTGAPRPFVHFSAFLRREAVVPAQIDFLLISFVCMHRIMMAAD